MGVRITGRRFAIAITVLLAVALAAAIGVRIYKKQQEGRDNDKNAPVTLEFAPADLAVAETKPLSRWLPVSGALQPVRQATVKSKVSGDVRAITVREGDAVQAGPDACADGHRRPRVEAHRAPGPARVRQGAAGDGGEDAVVESEAPEAELHLAERVRQLRVEHERDAAAASCRPRPTCASRRTPSRMPSPPRRSAGIVAKRHVQPGEKVAFDTPLVTVVDLKEIELQAMVPAVDIPELRPGMAVELAVDGFGERKFAGRIERINPSTEPGTRAILVFVGVPNPEQRAARRHVLDRARRARGERARDVAAGRRGAHRSRADVRLDDRGRQARQAHGASSAAATRRTAGSRSRPRCRLRSRCSRRASTT